MPTLNLGSVRGPTGATGETGATGATGNGIASISRTSGNGVAGTTDTYTVTFTSGASATFTVYNGADGLGAGDMLKATYDPNGKNADAFSMGNMIEETTNKIFTATERNKLSGIAENANYYTHPSTHSADMITEGTTNKAYTAAEKTKLAGIETGATADMTAAEILTAVETVDGAGSGLDADLLDGNHASAFAAASHGHAAGAVSAGTLAGQVNANASAAGNVGTAQVRDIYTGTSDMTAGSTALATGSIYLVYE